MANSGTSTSGNFHAVRFYRDAEGLCRIVADFLAEGFAADQPAIVIATPAHREGIEQQLASKQIDVDGLSRAGKLIALDADETLSQFIVDGMPDSTCFKRAIVPAIERASGGSADCTVRAYGEMVDVLWKAGQTVAATRVETLWNALANTHRFSLLCGYSMGSFYKAAAVDEICSHHSHVVSEDGHHALIS